MTRTSFYKSPLSSLLFIGLIAISSVSACSKEEASSGAPAGSLAKEAPAANAIRVETAKLSSLSLERSIVRPGEVIGSREAKLAASLGGYVEKVFVKSGQSIAAKSLIARVDSATHGARASLSKVEVEDAGRELARLQKMGKASPAARKDAAKARLDRAKAQHRISVTNMSRSNLKAPFAGVIVDWDVEEGEVLPPGQPVGRLLQLDPIRVSVSVSDRDLARLKVGDSAMVTSSGLAQPQKGSIHRIHPAANMSTRTFLVEVDLPNPERKLLPGMIATVEFEPSGNTDGKLYLPQDLLVTQLKGNGVFQVADGKAKWTPLKLGRIVGDQVEVLSGISAGATIVTTGHRNLNDGDALIVAREGECCQGGKVFFQQPAVKSAPAKKAEAGAKQ